MGAGGSVANYAGASEDGGAKATTEATAHITAMGVGPESDTGKKLMQQFGALATFKNLMGEFHTDDDGNPDPYSPKFPGGTDAILADKEGDELMAAKKAISSWCVYGNLNGYYLLEKNHDKVFALYMGIGPVQFEQKMGPKTLKLNQIRRKDMVQKLTEVGVVAAQCNKAAEGRGMTEEQIALGIKGKIKAQVDVMMKDIGKEKSQSTISYPHYEAGMKLLVEKESDNGLENWDAAMWTIKDPSKCPIAAAVKKELDSLDTKGEFGIDLNEWRCYWAEVFAQLGEEKTIASLNIYAEVFGVTL